MTNRNNNSFVILISENYNKGANYFAPFFRDFDTKN